jgi:hypothetical protein
MPNVITCTPYHGSFPGLYQTEVDGSFVDGSHLKISVPRSQAPEILMQEEAATNEGTHQNCDFLKASTLEIIRGSGAMLWSELGLL